MMHMDYDAHEKYLKLRKRTPQLPGDTGGWQLVSGATATGWRDKNKRTDHVEAPVAMKEATAGKTFAPEVVNKRRAERFKSMPLCSRRAFFSHSRYSVMSSIDEPRLQNNASLSGFGPGSQRRRGDAAVAIYQTTGLPRLRINRAQPASTRKQTNKRSGEDPMKTTRMPVGSRGEERLIELVRERDLSHANGRISGS
ncbi:hypothetical protein EYF80_026859 [Liparis tanakae]|uniref:Uncharacterized protein n=1 Tax=Liparis tanakae TaxID=230148 RepID=A0A4Z2HAI3_9TELE|nr:hypothetical protein EYF80_026859 [Liparis tanakae]